MTIDYQKTGLLITRAHKAFCPPGWNWRSEGSGTHDMVLWLVVKGRGTLQMPSGKREIRAGDLYVFRMWKPHFATHDPNNTLVVPYVKFHHLDSRGKAFRPRSEDLLAFYRRIENPAFFGQLVQRVINAFEADDPLLAEHWLRSCLLELRRREKRDEYTSQEREQLEQINRLCLEMQAAPGGAPRIYQAAENLGYSTDHLIRLFRKYKRVTPGEYLLQSRMRNAAELLMFSDRSVTQIADILGYRDIYAFSKQFRNRMGRSPSAYRREHK